MNGRKPGENSGSVLSFTYLDVLVCTMGSLLLMLVMFGEKAKLAAIAEAQAKEAEPAAAAPSTELAMSAEPTDDPTKLAHMLAEAESRHAELVRLRDQARDRLRDEQQRAAHSEQQQRVLEHDLAKLNLTLRALQAAEEKQTVDEEVAEQELQRLAKLVADTEQRVDQMRKDNVGKRSYAIVPYKGPNGTSRRPIFIECTHDAIVIQPEGIRLTEADFEAPITAGNPLAAAIRAAHEELNARARAGGETDPPDAYPLFIVRPDGVNAYEVALAATRTWDSDFGYEFVEADWNLEYPQPDARLAQITSHAVEQARERQKLLALAAPRRYSGRMLGAGAGAGGGRGRAGASGGLGTGDGGQSGGGDSSSIQLAGGTSPNRGTFAEETAQAHGGTGNELGLGGAAGDLADTRYGRQGGGEIGGALGEYASSATQGDAGTPGAPSATYPASGDGRYGAGTTAGAQPMNHNGTAGGAPHGSAAANSQSSTVNGSTSSSAGAPNTGPASASSAQAMDAFDPHAAPGSAERQAASTAAAARGQPEGAAGIGLANNLTKDRNVESAAKSRGANWANSAVSQRSSAITRPIQVMIRADQLVVLDPNDYTSGGAVVSFNQPSDKVLDQLAAAVKRQVADWGIAGRGMYWRPELVFVVATGAEPHAARLAALMDDSGVDVRLPQVATRPQEGARASR